MNKLSNDLSKEIISVAEKNGAILVGTTKIYEVESVIVIGTPLNENWHLGKFFSEAKRIYEERNIARSLLKSITEAINKEGFKTKHKNSFSLFGDLRPLAVDAGLGHWGRNGLIINKKYSSGLVLQAIITDAPIEIKEQPEILKCSECELCVELCPSKALSEGRLNYRKCLPYSLRGCSQCQKACGYAMF